MNCNLCPRNCNTDRKVNMGYCKSTDEIRLARAALHFYEEPCISGKEGSGAVFFSGCNLRCVFCQNKDIALGVTGKKVSVTRLSEIFLELQEKRANNINLVTATHYLPKIIKAVEMARNNGLILPIVYNTSSYEKVDAIKMLEGIVDIYLPDMKYMEAELAKKLSNAEDYPVKALAAIDEMVRQKKDIIFDDRNMMQEGVIIRHLILPGHTSNSIKVIDSLLERYGSKVYLSIMNQYTPVVKELIYKELTRGVTKREYEKVLNHALDSGLENGFFQDGKTIGESFIPKFDLEGV